MALNTLKSSKEDKQLEALDKFLSLNKDVLTNPLYLEPTTEQLPNSEDFSIRGSKFTTTESLKNEAEKISSILKVSKLESLRVISLTEKRVPNIDNNTDLKHDLQTLYINNILKERQKVLELTRYLLTQGPFPVLEDKYSEDLLKNSEFITSCITSLGNITLLLKSEEDTKFKALINNELASTIIHTLKLLLSLLIKVSTTSANVVKWFQFWEKNKYFEQLQDHVTIESYKEIKSLISITTLLFFGLDTSNDSFDTVSPYFSDSIAIRAINDSLANAPIDPIVIYAWSIILYSIASETKEKAFPDIDEDLSKVFATQAAVLNVFKVIEDYHSVLEYDNFHSAIFSSFLISVVPFIHLTDSTSKAYLSVFKKAPDSFVEKFFLNPNTERLLHLTKAKFPEVIIPYLRILSINGGSAHSQLATLSSYMSIRSTSELSYDVDTENDLIILKEGVYINPPYERNKDVLLYLPPKTKGKILPTADQNTDAIIFQYEYKGWSLLGRILQNESFYPEKSEILLDILELLTNTISASDIDTISEIFENASAFLDDGDIIDIILKLFEQSLHQRNKNILVKIINFFSALVYSYPQIVWSHLSRSDLLENAGRGGLISTILGSVEAVNGEYEFTIACLKLYNELIINNIIGSEELNTHKTNVLPRFTTFAIHVFESFIYWDYVDTYQKFQISTLILDSLTKILYSSYGIDLETKPEDKVTKVLAASAKKIIQSFIISLPDVRVIKPIFALLNASVNYPSLFEANGREGFWFTQSVKANLEFSKLVISIRSLLDTEPSTLEVFFFDKSTELVRAYSRYSSLRAKILQLLIQLVSSKWDMEPPSLLSHLGDYYTEVLVASLQNDLKSIYDDIKVKRYIYSFFSSIILGKQKGLSMIFVNGSESKENKTKKSSILSTLKNDVQNLDYYPASLSIHLVDAIAFALNSWSYKDENDTSQFIGTLAKKISELRVQNPQDNDSIIKSCYAYKLNSRITEICALIIFTSKDDSKSKPIIDALQNHDILELIKPLYEPFAYRASLHVNLNKNFEEKWPGLKLQQFVRSPLSATRTFGEGTVYDLSLLDDILSENPYWTGSGLVNGYRSEVISASLNLQYVSAQIGAAKSWGALLTAYVKRYKTQSSFWLIIKKLLQANIEEGTSTPLFHDVYRVRTELAFFFLYSITTNSKLDYNQNKEILELSLKLVCSSDVNLLSKIALNEYGIYRPLLRIISKCLGSAEGNAKLAEDLSPQLLEFFEIVIAKGTTVLFDSVQGDINKSTIDGRIEDIFLIISLLKGLINTKPHNYFISKLSNYLVDYSTLRAILNTYANSHNLRVNEEPIFAELTLTYIIELISVDGIAEQLISSGLFSTLIESPISVRIQEGNIQVHTTPRLHNIWSNGLLAIILILLGKFGDRLLPEISAFVSYFAKQIRSNTKSWSQDTVAITFPALQETEQIILLQKGLEKLYYEYGQTTSIQLPESIGGIPGLDTTQDLKDLSNSLIHLLAHPKYLTSRVIPTTLEEQKLFEGEDKIRTPLVEQLVSEIKELQESIA